MRPGRKFSIKTSEPAARRRIASMPSGRLEVDRDRALVPVERQEVGGVVSHERRSPVAGVVTVPGTFDLDHVGAQVAQDLRRERSREHPREVQDPESGQREAVHRAETTRLIGWAHQGVLSHNWRIALDNRRESVCERAEPRARQCIPRRCRGSHRAGRTAGSHACGAWQGIGLPRSIVDRSCSAGPCRAGADWSPQVAPTVSWTRSPVAEGERETIERKGRRSRKQHGGHRARRVVAVSRTRTWAERRWIGWLSWARRSPSSAPS